MGKLLAVLLLTSIQKYNSLNSGVKWLITLSTITVIGTFYFYGKIDSQSMQLESVDAWAVALDISLAHLLITLPIVIISITLCVILFALIAYLINSLINIIVKLFVGREKEAEISIYDSCFVMITLFSITAYAIFRIDKFLLIDTIDLQQLIFGAHDRSMGFLYPTTYRFTSILDNFEPFKQNLITNPILTKIFTALAAIAALFTALTGLTKFLQYLGGIFKK